MTTKSNQSNTTSEKPKERPPLPERPKGSSYYETFSIKTEKGEKRKK